MEKLLKFKDFSSLLEDITSSLNKLETAINLVNQKDVDSRITTSIVNKLEDTAQFVEKVSHITNIHEIFVNQKGFSEGDFENLKNILQKDSEDSLIALSDYLKNPKDITFFEGFKDATNLPKTISNLTKISESTLLRIFGMEGNMKGGKGVGRGELFLGLMIKDAKNSGKGDVNVNNIMYEVKAKNARLTTTNGFNLGGPAIISFLESLPSISTELKKYENLDPSELNFTFKKKPSKLFDIVSDSVKLGVLDEVISSLIQNVFVGKKSIWPKASPLIKTSIERAFKQHINRRGDLDMDSLNYSLLHTNALYYQELEKFHAFFLINPSTGDFAVFNPNSQGENWLKANVSYVIPSWEDNPTSMCYKIKLK